VLSTEVRNNKGFTSYVTQVLGLFCNASAKYTQGLCPSRAQGVSPGFRAPLVQPFALFALLPGWVIPLSLHLPPPSPGGVRHESQKQKQRRNHHEQLEAGHSEALNAYLNAMSRFHTYSCGNILEIARQKPDATRVAGLYAWNQLGRKVKKGEKGIRILAPIIGVRRKKDEEAEKAITRQNRAVLVGFRAVIRCSPQAIRASARWKAVATLRCDFLLGSLGSAMPATRPIEVLLVESKAAMAGLSYLPRLDITGLSCSTTSS
jgi:hypothetical protein